MIDKILIGDIFESQAQTIINTVNCVGIMGKGIAAEFKKRFPEMFKDYKLKCERNQVVLGKPYLYKRLFNPWIINFPTKQHWRSLSKIKDIQDGLEYLTKKYKEWGIQSLAVPPLGCGNGQLEWRQVGPLIYSILNRMEISVELYAPFGTSPKELTRDFLSQTPNIGKIDGQQITNYLNPAWLVLVEILYELEKHRYRTPVGRTIFQKIAYVATELNLPTNFQYKQSSFGPFSNDVKKAISILANNGLVVEEQYGKMFRLTVGSNYLSMREKYKSEIEKYRKIIERTSDLFARMDTQQSEIVTTIFYSARQLKKQNSSSITENEIFTYVLNWKKRRRPPLDKTQVASAIRNLAMLRWLDVEYSEELPVSENI